jgi:P4 family phage/plasmid primase-like protien
LVQPFISVNSTKEFEYTRFRFQFPYCKVTSDTISKQYYPALKRRLRKENVLSYLKKQPTDNWDKIINSKICFEDIPLYGSIKSRNDTPLVFETLLERVSKKHIENKKYPKLEIKDGFCFDKNEFIDRNIVSKNFFNKNVDKEYYLPLLLSINYCSRLVSSRRKKYKKNTINRVNEGTETAEQLNEIREMSLLFINMISIQRFKEEYYWKDIGKALYNVYEGDKEGLKVWKNFTKKGGVISQRNCDYLYQNFDTDNYLSIKTLAFYAKEDSFDEYKKWKNEWIRSSMDECFSLSESDIAVVLYRIYWLRFCCSSIENKKWYMFNNIWRPVDSGYKLREKISGCLCKKFEKYRTKISKEVADARDPNVKATGESKISTITKLIRVLKSTGKKDNIMKEAMEKFKDDNFEKRVNKDPNLFAVENCVIEATSECCIVRKGKPEDYINICTSVKYDSSLTWESPQVISFMEWMKKCFIDKNLIDYVLKFFASCIRSKNTNKLFATLTGDGDNSKSTFVKAIELVFGDYSFTFPTNLITGKQRNIGSATPELALAEYAKIAFISEPGDDEYIRNGPLKSFTGNDKIFSRKLHSNGGSFVPMYKTVLMCNKIPTIPGADKAIIRRFKAIPFGSVWSKDAPDDIEEQYRTRTFKVDSTFEEKLSGMASAILWVLVQYYKEYCSVGLTEPDIVTEASQKYWDENDIYILFKRECIKQSIKQNSITPENPDVLSISPSGFSGVIEFCLIDCLIHSLLNKM